MCKMKVFKNFWKLYLKYYFLKRNVGVPGADQGDPPCHHTTLPRGRGVGRAVAWCGPHLALHSPIFLSFLSLSRPNTPPFFKLLFLLLLLGFFDLLAQPIFVDEIWTICSPVCDSSMYPSWILFSRVYLEYFSAVGDLLSEYACLFYVDIISFDACLVL